MALSKSDVRQYHDEGYTIVEGFLTPAELTLLQSECDAAIDRIHQRMDREKTDTFDLTERGKRYQIRCSVQEVESLERFALSSKMEDVVRQLVGETAYLFLDIFVCKGGRQGKKLAWHQDAGYLTNPKEFQPVTKPYLTCWIPLDDVHESNGTVYVLPYSRAPRGRDLNEHVLEADSSHELVGYTGDDPGDVVICPAGSLVAFSSYTLHRSGPNTTGEMRRVYVLQYSVDPILKPDGSVAMMAKLLLAGGKRVATVPG